MLRTESSGAGAGADAIGGRSISDCVVCTTKIPERQLLSLPLVGRVGRAKRRPGWGFGCIHPPPGMSFASLTTCHPPHEGEGFINFTGSPPEPFRLARQFDRLDLLDLDRTFRHQVVEVAVGRARDL